MSGGLAKVHRLNSPFATPTVPVKVIPDAEHITPRRPSGGTEAITSYSSSVRDSASVREALKPTAKPQTPREEAEKTNAENWAEMNARWRREAEEADARRYTETVRL
jgi:hypothetical protein